VTGELAKSELSSEAGKVKLTDTRRQVQQGWAAISDILVAEGQPELAAQVRKFVAQMEPAMSSKELIALQLVALPQRAPLVERHSTR
jgi:hypothetical protein